jgi:FtsH-binding integral membrane protein
MVCCCFVCGLVGLILAITGNSNRDQHQLLTAHRCGVTSIACGVVQWICCIGFAILYVLFIAYDLYSIEFNLLILPYSSSARRQGGLGGLKPPPPEIFLKY